ncbi:MAG TPA: hypothetical protein VD886_12110, partial [Herpetosiphonaceae bacterium]|nr:hypothetical protein [Herpetosiphonaceae bacterium]
MVHRSRRPRMLGLGLLVVCAISVILPFALGGAAPDDSPEAAVRRAWGLASASGTYRYRSQVEQTSYPRHNLANTGRSARQERFSLEGSVDQPNETMELSVWPNSGGRASEAIGMRVERGKTYSRRGQGAWETDESAGSDMFAPGGDPLGFLAGLSNVRLAGDDRLQFATASGSAQDLTLSYARYAFDLDGAAFAGFVQARMEDQLRAAGRLPSGVSLDAGAYRGLAGSGEIWIDAEGLPRRLKLSLELPPQQKLDRISATIDSEYFDFDTRRLALASTGFGENPGAWLSFRLATHRAALQRLALQLAFGLAMVGLAALAVVWRRRRRVYLATVSAVILSMLLTPLARAAEVETFVRDQRNRQATQEAAAERQDGLAEARAALAKSNWNPNQNPLEAPATAAAQPDPPIGPASVSAAQSGSDSDSLTDSDGDGLSDADEEAWQTCPYAGSTSAGCAGVADPTDSDGDGLTDGAEVNQLNTYPGMADTDGDTITDTLEVEGFLYNGSQWYLDPNESDTNRDGMVDSTECAAMSTAFGSFDANAGCPDTDGDGEPDLFDDDNDGDGVHDVVDLSASSFSAQTYD